MRERNRCVRHRPVGATRPGFITHCRAPFGNSDFRVADRRRIRAMHTDRKGPALGRMRTVQLPQQCQVVAGGGLSAVASAKADDARQCADFCALKFCSRFIEARREPVLPLPFVILRQSVASEEGACPFARFITPIANTETTRERVEA